MKFTHSFNTQPLMQECLFYIALLQFLFLPFLFQPDTTSQEFNIVFLTVGINASMLLFLLVVTNRTYSLSLIDVSVCLWMPYSLIGIFSVDTLHWYKLILFVCVYVLAKGVASRNGRLILYAVLLSGLIQGGFGLLQSADVYMSNHRAFVATGSFANPGPFGGYVGIALFASLGMLFYLKGRSVVERYSLYVSILILGIACFVSDSRAAWIGVVFAFMSMALWKCKLPKKKYWVVGMFAFLSIVLSLFYSYKPISADARILIWKVCGTMVQEEPLLGTGVGTFPSTYMYHQAAYLRQFSDSTEKLIAGDNVYAFNEYIKILCEQGVVGLIFFLFILFVAFCACFRSPNDNKLMLLCPLVAYLAFSFFSYPSEVLPLYLLLPLLLGGLSGCGDKVVCGIKFNKWSKLLCVSLFLTIGIEGCRNWLFKNEVKRQLTSYFFKDDKKSAVYLKNTCSDYRICPELVLQYSSAFYLKGEYADAIPPLKQIMALSPSSATACDLGNCYQYTKDYVKAESYYSLASEMVPGLITPKYLLFLMYVEIGQLERARRLAKEIVAMPVKRISESTKIIKTETDVYLRSIE